MPYSKLPFPAMENDETRIVQTHSGPILAEQKAGLVHARGVPYAQAKRFEASQLATAWTDVKDCTRPGAMCPQLPFDFDFVLGPIAGIRHMDEDCLKVSIIYPADVSPTSKLPVVVWYHGGANISGATDIEINDMSELARRGVVTVSIAYRLGIFGFLPIDDIAPANLGIQDQILGLRWTRDNVATFGGDPENVTIFGQSAGASAVYTLMLASETEGLYRRAILISAPLGMIYGGKEPKTLARRAHDLLGGSAESALQKSTDELIAIQKTLLEESKKRGAFGAGFLPAWGASPLPKEGDVKTRLKQIAKVKPIFVGWTADDCLPFVEMTPLGKTVVQAPLVGSLLAPVISKVATTMVFKRGAQNLHQLWTDNGGESSTVCFEWFPPGSRLRACHCIEMAFLFGTWETWADTPLITGKTSEAIVAKVGPVVKDLFVGFVQGHVVPGQHIVVDENFSSTSYRQLSAN